jgi:hypothetical protein
MFKPDLPDSGYWEPVICQALFFGLMLVQQTVLFRKSFSGERI